jgi:hypothetical protein
MSDHNKKSQKRSANAGGGMIAIGGLGVVGATIAMGSSAIHGARLATSAGHVLQVAPGAQKSFWLSFGSFLIFAGITGLGVLVESFSDDENKKKHDEDEL